MKHDILKFTTDMTMLKINGNKIEGLKTKKIDKTAARIFKDDKIFSAAHIGAISDEALLAKAERAGNVGLGYDYHLPSTAALKSDHFKNQSREKGIQAFTEFFNDLKKDYKNLNFWSGFCNFEKSSTRFSSNYTGELEAGGDKVTWQFLYKEYGSTDFADGYLYFDGVHTDFAKIRSHCEPILKAVDLKATVESKKMPVMILESWDIGSRLTQDLKPERFHAGSSYLSNKLGKKIFSDKVSFRDVSYLPERGRFNRFDGEGVLHKNPVIFEKGVFSNVLYDLRQGQKAGKESTGNGRREFNSGASFNLFELVLEPGPTDIWDMLKDVPECLVVQMGYGGGISDQWEYSTPVQVGYLFRHGKPVGRVPSVSIKANFADLLGKDLIGVSKDGWCEGLMPAILTQAEVIAH